YPVIRQWFNHQLWQLFANRLYGCHRKGPDPKLLAGPRAWSHWRLARGPVAAGLPPLDRPSENQAVDWHNWVSPRGGSSSYADDLGHGWNHPAQLYLYWAGVRVLHQLGRRLEQRYGHPVGGLPNGPAYPRQ